jgi:hypothetical protein|tara:strand:+ start:978 stop:1208 length:231 start_codon:yes stop_codon:yes gene_type:complete
VTIDINEVQLGKYRHFKGNLYELIEIAHHSESQEPVAVYRALYGDHGLWVRPLEMFLETIERDGAEIQRFQYIKAE